MRGPGGGIRQLVALRRADGRESWRAGVLGLCNPPVAAGGRLFCPAARLYAFDADTGALLWEIMPPGRLDLVQGTADAERVYAGTTDFDGQTTEAFAADAATGEIVWRRQFTGPGWAGARLRSLTLSPEGDLLVALTVLLPSDRPTLQTAAVVAVDPATGAERWRYQDPAPAANLRRDLGDLTLFEDLALYSDAESFEAVAFRRGTGEVAWRVPWTPRALGPLRAPVVEDGTAYFSDGLGGVFAVDARTGVQRWRTAVRGGSFSHEVCGPVVLLNNGPVEVIDRATGRRRGLLLADRDNAGQTAIADGVAYVSSESGVYAFDCRS